MHRVKNRIVAGAGAAVLAVAGAAAAALSTAGPAQAADAELELPAYGDLVVDDRYGQVYISGGPTSNGVVVTNRSGRVEKIITGQYGATGLALSADERTLYVAQAAGDAISAIDTRTLKETARYSTGARTCPTHLVRAGERLFFGHGCDGTWSGGVGRVTFPAPPGPSPSPSSPSPSSAGPASPSPSLPASSAPGSTPSAPLVKVLTTTSPTPSPSTTPEPPKIDLHVQGSVRFQRAPLLAARDNAAGPLVAGQPNLSLSTVYVYDIGTDGAVTTRTSGTAPGSNLNDIAVDKYGTTFFTGAGSRNATQAYAVADLSGRGSYYTGYYPLAVAQSPDGLHLASAVRATGDDVYVYEMGGVIPERRLDVSTDVVAPRGLVWAPDGDTLYVVTQPPAGGPPTLHVVGNPTL